MFDWNDLRHFLAVAEAGSTLSAARTLNVSQPTVVRRIAALEEALSLTLFERSPAGYRLTEAGLALRGDCEAVAAAAGRVEQSARAFSRDIAGTVRISVFEMFATTLVGPLLGELREAHPRLRVELDLSDRISDLDAREADIAVRSAKQLAGNRLVCRRLVEERWAYCCSKAYAEAHGIPASPREVGGHVFVGDGSEDLWPAHRDWRRAEGLTNTIDLHHATATAVLDMVRSGLAIGLIPLIATWRDPTLHVCFELPWTGHHLWLVTSEQMRHAPRVRAVMEFLAMRTRVMERRAGHASS